MAANNPPTNSSDGNVIPGMSYLERLSARYTTVIAGQTSQANNLWKALKDGKWNHTDLGKVFVSAVEGYYDLAVTAMKGPNYTVRPEHAYFCFGLSVATNPTPEVEIAIELQLEGTKLEQTDFVQVGGPHIIPGRNAPQIVYKKCRLTDDRRAVLILLDDTMLQKAKPGHYTSLVGVQGRGGQAPLVIVTLIIEP